MHDPAKPQHGPTVLTGCKFKAVQLLKNLGASIARFPSQCQVLLLGEHVALVDHRNRVTEEGKGEDGPAILV